MCVSTPSIRGREVRLPLYYINQILPIVNIDNDDIYSDIGIGEYMSPLKKGPNK